LNHGTGSQYPIRRTTRYRTVVNANDLTTNLRATDPGSRRMAWWLRYQGLADSELAALTALFRDTRGPLRSFTYLDPEANLLSHSEGLTNAVWQKSAGLSVGIAASNADVAQTSFQMVSSPGQAGEIYQWLDVPASYRWVLSVYARSTNPAQVSLFLRKGADERSRSFPLTPAWRRYSFGDQFWTTGEGLDAGFRMGGGASVEITALQLECQAAPSRYKRSDTHGGVYPDARFSQDTLRVTTLAANCHQISLIITAPLPE
jgi:hypothetical protein